MDTPNQPVEDEPPTLPTGDDPLSKQFAAHLEFGREAQLSNYDGSRSREETDDQPS